MLSIATALYRRIRKIKEWTRNGTTNENKSYPNLKESKSYQVCFEKRSSVPRILRWLKSFSRVGAEPGSHRKTQTLAGRLNIPAHFLPTHLGLLRVRHSKHHDLLNGFPTIVQLFSAFIRIVTVSFDTRIRINLNNDGLASTNPLKIPRLEDLRDRESDQHKSP